MTDPTLDKIAYMISEAGRELAGWRCGAQNYSADEVRRLLIAAQAALLDFTDKIIAAGPDTPRKDARSVQQELGDAAGEIEFLLPALRAEHYRITQVLQQALRAIRSAERQILEIQSIAMNVIDWNGMARRMQRHGAAGTEEELEAALKEGFRSRAHGVAAENGIPRP